MAEIGRRFGVSRQRVDQILRRAGVADAGTARSRARRAAQAASVRELHARLARERSREILEAYRSGLDVREIARDLGLQHGAVRALISEARTNADRAARARVLRRVEQPRFTELEICRGVSLVAERVAGVPTCGEYERLARELGLASLATIQVRFGSWSRVLHAAGFDAPARTVRSQRWDAAACWEALESVADVLGDPPRYHRYARLAQQRDDLPSGPTVRQRLGLWSDITGELTARQAQNGGGSRTAGRDRTLEQPGPVEPAATPPPASDAGPRRLPSLLGARALRYLAEHPGSSGRSVGRGLRIRHDSQTWALLHRFERDGLVAKQPNGVASAWALTRQGHAFLRDLPEGVYA